MLTLVGALLQAWHDGEVRYCHWKSNHALDRGTSGRGDMDILVSSDDICVATNALHQLGFKRLVEEAGSVQPGVEHWIGLSEPEGAIAHIHLHYRLVFGEKFVKSYRFPHENDILARRMLESGVYQINKADELVMLFVRSVLKVDFIWIAKWAIGYKKHLFPDHIVDEYGFLLRHTSDLDLATAASRLLPIEASDLVKVIGSFEQLGIVDILVLRQRLRKTLRWWRRLSWLQSLRAAGIAYWRLFWRRASIGRKAKKRVCTGGVRIALLGADGAGKSTMVKEIAIWLGQHLDVKVLYAGSGDGQKGVVLRVLELINVSLHGRRIARRRQSDVTGDALERENSATSAAQVIRALAIVLHRRKIVRAGNRHANNGSVVIYDRFPQPFQRNYADGPKIEPKGSRLGKWLSGWELQSYELMYRNFPDRVFVLKVDPAVSVARKSENISATIEKKNAVLDRIMLDKTGHCTSIDANQDYDLVLKDLKRAVWKWL